MKSERFLLHVALAGVLALVLYAVLFALVENHRARRGPWRVTFATVSNSVPRLVINQPTLGITNVSVLLPGATPISGPAATVSFAQARRVPFATPLGQCVFLDTITLPGTVVLEAGGHQIQLLPRVLTIDRRERPWRSGEIISLLPLTPGSNGPPAPTPAAGRP